MVPTETSLTSHPTHQHLQSSATPKDVAIVTVPSKFQHLQEEYPEVFCPELPHVPSKHGFYYHIMMLSPPVHARFQRLSPEKFQEAKQTFLNIEEMGLCLKAYSPWTSPFYQVKKDDSS